MDAVKEEHNIDVLLYTFSKEGPSYIKSEYHVKVRGEYSLGNMGLTYHEKQICVTKDCFIVDKIVAWKFLIPRLERAVLLLILLIKYMNH